jgi:signal transduction histidine kinase
MIDRVGRIGDRLLRSLRGLPPVVGDVGLTAMALAAQFAPFVSDDYLPGDDRRRWLMYLAVIASALPVLWRRRAPLAVLIATELSAAAYSFFPDGARQPIWFGAVIALFTLAAHAPKWQRISALVLLAWGAVIFTGSLETAARGIVVWTAAYAMGRAWASRRAYTDRLEERALHLERERELEAERERARIARDMHDILAHAVSIMIAQAEAGPVAIRRGPERAVASFETIASAGRDAMTQLRRILGVLNDGDGPLRPQPTLSDIASLVSRVAQTGPRTQLAGSGQPGTLAADAEVAAYRIVQEALTNVVKHANAETISVALDWRDGDLFITVTDDGRLTTTAGRESTTTEQGHGLIGIRERARSCGGAASFGPAPHGPGFQVSVRLPGTMAVIAP